MREKPFCANRCKCRMCSGCKYMCQCACAPGRWTSARRPGTLPPQSPGRRPSPPGARVAGPHRPPSQQLRPPVTQQDDVKQLYRCSDAAMVNLWRTSGGQKRRQTAALPVFCSELAFAANSSSERPHGSVRRTAASRSACAAIDDARWASRYASDRDVRARLMRCARSSLTTLCVGQK